MTARVHFQEKLDEIRTDVVRMGNETLDMIRTAVEATLSGDGQLAELVVAQDDSIDAQERAIFIKSVVAVMQEAPVANDLRLLVATMGTVTEIEKAADHAVKMCRRLAKLQGAFPSELKVALQDLGEQARRQFSAAIRLYTSYDRTLANEIISGDREVDSSYSQARHRVYQLLQETPEAAATHMRTIQIFHSLEHVADQAVEIVRRLRMLYDLSD